MQGDIGRYCGERGSERKVRERKMKSERGREGKGGNTVAFSSW